MSKIMYVERLLRRKPLMCGASGILIYLGVDGLCSGFARRALYGALMALLFNKSA